MFNLVFIPIPIFLFSMIAFIMYSFFKGFRKSIFYFIIFALINSILILITTLTYKVLLWPSIFKPIYSHSSNGLEQNAMRDYFKPSAMAIVSSVSCLISLGLMFLVGKIILLLSVKIKDLVEETTIKTEEDGARFVFQRGSNKINRWISLGVGSFLGLFPSAIIANGVTTLCINKDNAFYASISGLSFFSTYGQSRFDEDFSQMYNEVSSFSSQEVTNLLNVFFSIEDFDSGKLNKSLDDLKNNSKILKLMLGKYKNNKRINDLVLTTIIKRSYNKINFMNWEDKIVERVDGLNHLSLNFSKDKFFDLIRKNIFIPFQNTTYYNEYKVANFELESLTNQINKNREEYNGLIFASEVLTVAGSFPILNMNEFNPMNSNLEQEKERLNNEHDALLSQRLDKLAEMTIKETIMNNKKNDYNKFINLYISVFKGRI